ncbi:hypothetical protein SAMN04487970_103766 [Paenibacillus tianmuensis]|uniref:Immunity protein 44 n=1 Tax=Paenibacillus tianmuensis TaxID=624147 RepID=A0A1G4SXZ6_9BACL|nr:hypothetical protein [Paenibacillus tianmuensis]SCW74044.1 hypothetical protein SAMN04487970_103766 [Paenibacillus tianmuensis]
MKSNLLTLESTELADIPQNVLPFRHVVYHIKELFMTFLPPIEINNSSKVEISFGPRGDESIFDGVLGVTNIFIEDFNFNNFYKLDKSKQEKEVLKIIVDSLCELSLRRNEDTSIINTIKMAANKVIESEFNLI